METFKIAFEIDPDLIAQAQALTPDEFLAGPGRDRSDIVIDQIFATALPTSIADLALDAGLTLKDGQPGEANTWPVIATSHAILFKEVVDPVHGIDFGVSAHDAITDQILGLYTGCTLVVDAANRGQGLGAALVQLRYLRNGDLPLWAHDEAGFTPAGEATHLSAHRRVADMSPS